MQIERLIAHTFRNLAAVDIVPEAPTVLLQGDNGQGKTNILEALYLCATGRSFRHAANRELLQHGQSQAACRAILVRGGVRHEVAVAIGAHQRQVRVDGRAVRPTTHLLELMNIVAFFPEDLRIAKGAPEDRRRFFDRAVANSQGTFVQAALNYQRVLRSRNALLRQPTPPDRSQLRIYDAQLVQLGGTLHACRAAVLALLQPVAQAHLATMMGGMQLGLALKSGVPGGDAVLPEDFAAAFAEALTASYGRDRARGMTCVGPHRADLLAQLDGRDVRAFASQGQQRSVVLALKLAEVVCLKTKLGSAPILVMDDVSSELDPKRCRLLFEVVHQHAGQAWVSTTGAAALPLCGNVHKVHVQGGSAA